ncbi:MAG TPA: cytochrome P450 [Anaerolineales bacterium]|nr:cytochrome P450 [Anaerolineales bacterium]
MTMTTPAYQRPIPGPRGRPVLGMMPEMVRDMLGLFTETAREYGGIAQFKLLNKTYLLVTNPDYVKYILQDNHKNYIRGRSVETGRVLLGNGLPLIDGEFWLPDLSATFTIRLLDKRISEMVPKFFILVSISLIPKQPCSSSDKWG